MANTRQAGGQQSGDSTTEPATTDVGALITAPLDAVRKVMPDSSVPVFLGAGALALGGVIEWPVVGAVGLGYFALRRWRPHTTRPPELR